MTDFRRPCRPCEGRGFIVKEVYDEGKLNPRSEVHECESCGGTGNATKPVLSSTSFKL